MLKRTLGRSFLMLLMLTGFAGTIDESSISQKERKLVVSLMKENRGAIWNSVKDLSDAQLAFRSAPGAWSIRDCIYHIAATERSLWSLLETSMQAPAAPEKRTAIRLSDEDVLKKVDCASGLNLSVSLLPEKSGYHTLDEAMADFKENRTAHIKYLKSSTEDLRNHVMQLPIGMIDCYQLCLAIPAHSEQHLLQIEEIKKDPAFPKQ